jgi:hypothetical protein
VRAFDLEDQTAERELFDYSNFFQAIPKGLFEAHDCPTAGHDHRPFLCARRFRAKVLLHPNTEQQRAAARNSRPRNATRVEIGAPPKNDVPRLTGCQPAFELQH